MLKRLMMIGLLGISLVAILAAEANAQIDGWGWFGYSDIRGEINTSKTPPPKTKPSALLATAVAQIQIACVNPANNGIFPGNSFTSEVISSSTINQANITDRKSGKATTPISLPLDQFEVSANCTNNNWNAIPDSAIAFAFSLCVEWRLCTGEDLNGDGDTDPCIDIDPTTGDTVLTIDESQKGLLDSKAGTCTLNTTLYPRDPDTGQAPSGATLDCTPPQASACTPP